jgi:flagellar biosynthesis component FlhA
MEIQGLLDRAIVSYTLALLHPIAGFLLLILAGTVGVLGWRYRRARLGKSGHDVPGTFQLMQQHQRLGMALLWMTFIVWCAGMAISSLLVLNGIVYDYPHQLFAVGLMFILAVSALVMLLFRQRTWASPVHLTLNGIVVILLVAQFVSGWQVLQQLFSF